MTSTLITKLCYKELGDIHIQRTKYQFVSKQQIGTQTL